MATVAPEHQAKAVVDNTTMATWAGAIARALAAKGIDDRALFAAAGVDHALVNNPSRRIAVADMTRLWKMAVIESGDATFGLRVAEQVNLTTFYSLGVAAMASADVRQAGDMVCRFGAMISDGINMQLCESERELGLVLGMRPGYPRFADACVEAVMAAVLHTARQLFPQVVRPSRVMFAHRCHGDPQQYRQFFDCPVTFSALEDGLFTQRTDLPEGELPSSSPQVAEVNAALCAEYLEKQQLGGVSNQVRELLHVMLSRGSSVSLAAVASELAMSERKLQRQLRDESVAFRDLLDEVRGLLARKMLKEPGMSVGRIAERLGFESISAFSRAFRRWYGTTPRAIRQDLEASSEIKG